MNVQEVEERTRAIVERRCPACHAWYDKDAGPCPHCAEAPPETNQALVSAVHTSKLNEHLFGMQAQARQEAAIEQRLKGGNRRTGRSPLDRPPSSFRTRSA